MSTSTANASASATGASSPFLELRGITKRFGGVAALDGVDITVGADELLVILGPTGAGKTTLLRTVAGLERPDAGRVCMGGVDVTDSSPAERDVALVFQNFSLYPRWTVRRNLAFPLQAPGRNLSATEIADRIARAAAILKIDRLLDRPATRLSGGEMQRVAIGRAIVRDPRLFLLDEPLTNLDAKLREALRIELVELRRRLRTPMVFVTHDQAEALSMADRIVVLGGGRVLQVGTPESVYRHPVSPLVARQLGQPAINLIPAVRLGDWWCLSPAAGGNDDTPTRRICRLSDTAALAGPVAEGAVRLLGVRPEGIAISGGELPARVVVVEHMGPSTIVVCEWEGVRLHLLASRLAGLKAGDSIHPLVDPAGITVWAADAPGGVAVGD